MKDFIVKTFATVFGLGYMPVAPGTFGTFGAAILWYFTLRGMDPLSYVVFLFIITIFSCYIAWLAEKVYGQKDSQRIVIDELCGYLLTVAFSGTVLLGLVGIIFFRLFDILKPWPIKKFEKLPGGIGVVADDLMAGVYGFLALRIVSYFIG